MVSTQISARAALLNELHAATRSEHSTLNKAITARLPLCLPPHASSPYLYAAGMTVYGQIYLAMENIWEELSEDDDTSGISKRHQELIKTLRTQYLERTLRLKFDLDNLQRSLGPSTASLLQNLHAEMLHIKDDIQVTIRAKPHLLIAYVWPMYLALFNGGRWIASQLLSAGPTFWLADEDITAQNFLSFWYFDQSVRDEHHGENVKVDLKQRLDAAAEYLMDTEKDEVVQEVKRVFAICSDLTALLDQHADLVREKQLKASQAATAPSSVYDWVTSMVSGRSVWQNLRSFAGFAAAPSVLRKEFEQPS